MANREISSMMASPLPMQLRGRFRVVWLLAFVVAIKLCPPACLAWPLGPIDVTNTSAAHSVVFIGERVTAGRAGHMATGIGDIDGDGFGDLAISAINVGRGRCYILFGSRDFAEGGRVVELDTVGKPGGPPGFIIEAADPSAIKAFFVLGPLGDVDGDNVDDAHFSGGFYTPNVGVEYVLLGRKRVGGGAAAGSPWPSVILAMKSWSADGYGFRIIGSRASDYMQNIVALVVSSCSRDFDGDGIADMLVLDVYDSISLCRHCGSLYMVRGAPIHSSASGGGPEDVVLASSNRSSLVALGEREGEFFFGSIKCDGDFDGDSVPDAAVVASDDRAERHVYVLYGSELLAASAATRATASTRGALMLPSDVANASSSTAGFDVRTGVMVFGAVATIEDIDSDGFDDILIMHGISFVLVVWGRATRGGGGAIDASRIMLSGVVISEERYMMTGAGDRSFILALQPTTTETSPGDVPLCAAVVHNAHGARRLPALDIAMVGVDGSRATALTCSLWRSENVRNNAFSVHTAKNLAGDGRIALIVSSPQDYVDGIVAGRVMLVFESERCSSLRSSGACSASASSCVWCAFSGSCTDSQLGCAAPDSPCVAASSDEEACGENDTCVWCGSRCSDLASGGCPRCEEATTGAECAALPQRCTWCGASCASGPPELCPACSAAADNVSCTASPRSCVWCVGECIPARIPCAVASCESLSDQDSCAAAPPGLACSWCLESSSCLAGGCSITRSDGSGGGGGGSGGIDAQESLSRSSLEHSAAETVESHGDASSSRHADLSPLPWAPSIAVVVAGSAVACAVILAAAAGAVAVACKMERRKRRAPEFVGGFGAPSTASMQGTELGSVNESAPQFVGPGLTMVPAAVAAVGTAESAPLYSLASINQFPAAQMVMMTVHPEVGIGGGEEQRSEEIAAIAPLPLPPAQAVPALALPDAAGNGSPIAIGRFLLGARLGVVASCPDGGPASQCQSSVVPASQLCRDEGEDDREECQAAAAATTTATAPRSFAPIYSTGELP
jgi:hypothetical protein